MRSDFRKRRLSRSSRNEIGDDVRSSKQRKLHSSNEDNDNASSTITNTLNVVKGVFSWIVDATTKNYFVDSAMSSVFHYNTSKYGKKKVNTGNRNGLDEEENKKKISSEQFTLKRSPLRASPLLASEPQKRKYLKTNQNFLTSSPSNGRNLTGNVRNFCSKNFTVSPMEERKVVAHPFAGRNRPKPFGNFSQRDEKRIGNDDNDRGTMTSSFSSLSVVGSTNVPLPSSSHSTLITNAPPPGPDIYTIGGLTYKTKLSATDDLDDREKYRMLLEFYTKCSAMPTASIMPSFKDQEAQTDMSGKSYVVSPMQQPFKRKYLHPSASSFLARYFKGQHLGIKSIAPTSTPQDTPKQQVATTKTPEPIDDDIIIEEVRMPTRRALNSSSYFSTEWINELRSTFDDKGVQNAKLIRNQQDQIKQFHVKRDERLAAKLKALELKLISETEGVEDTSVAFPELSPAMEEVIDNAFDVESQEEVLSVGFNISITRKDIETLTALNWLNDEIIFFYMNLLMERSKNDNYPKVYAFNTFFLPKLMTGGHAALKRWTRKVDIFAHDLILVPVHMGVHWCLAVIDFRHKTIRYYDSMGGTNNECVQALRNYLRDELKDKKKESFDASGWVLESVKDIPRQMNGSDCGMFTCKYAEYITRDAKINFNQDHMQYFRRRMIYEILAKKLL